MPRNAMSRGDFYDAALFHPELGAIADLRRLAIVGYVGPLQQHRGCLAYRGGARYSAPSSAVSDACFVDARLRPQRISRGIDPGLAAGDRRVEVSDPLLHHQSCCPAAQFDARGLPDTA